MRLKIPMTGTVTDFDPESYKLDGIGISGDPADPVRPVPIDLGNVAWRLVRIDLENDLMEVEIASPENVSEPAFDGGGKPVLDGEGKQMIIARPATPAEKQALLENAQHIMESKTSDELYALTKAKKLVKPAHVMAKYNQFKEANSWLTKQ